MKKKILIVGILTFNLLLGGCGGITSTNGLVKVTTPLTYKDLLGTYTFKPDTFQARKLGIKFTDEIILKITDDSLIVHPKKSKSVLGKYYINKMILVTNDQVNKSYTGTWSFLYLKDEVAARHDDSNLISFNQKVSNNYDISFDITKDNTNTLHLAGYMSDPKYEVVQVIDFKKVK